MLTKKQAREVFDSILRIRSRIVDGVWTRDERSADGSWTLGRLEHATELIDEIQEATAIAAQILAGPIIEARKDERARWTTTVDEGPDPARSPLTPPARA